MRRELFLRRSHRYERRHIRSGMQRAIPRNESSGKAGTVTRLLTYVAATGAEQRSRREAAKYQTRVLTRRGRWPMVAVALIAVAAVGLGWRQSLVAAALPIPQRSSITPAQQATPPATDLSTPTLVPTVAAATPVAPPQAPASPPIEFDIQGDGPTFRVSGVGALGLFLRPAPNRSGTPLKVLAEGSVVTVLSGDLRGDGWTWNRVRDQDGTEGWVVSQYLTQQAAPSPAAEPGAQR